MKWIRDSSGRFDQRPFFEGADIDYECETMIDECMAKRNQSEFAPPLDDNALNVLLEMHSESVDLYADLEKLEGPGVEGLTIFQKGQRPRIYIDKRLSESSARVNRLRSTMAHELFHARFHAPLWELHWLGKPGNLPCSESQIMIAGRTDWYEWQAAYGGGAILMPLSAIQKIAGDASAVSEVSEQGVLLTMRVADTFRVSKEAAQIRLIQLGILESKRHGQRVGGA